MIQKISKSDKILKKLPKSKLNWTSEQQSKLDDNLSEMMRDSKYKQNMSELRAKNVILNG